MERETATFETPNGHTVVAHTYLTGREAQAIQQVFLSKTGVDVSTAVGGKKPELKMEINAGLSIDAQNKAVEMLVVSVDGHTKPQDNPEGSVLDLVLDLRDEDTECIIKKIDELTKKNEQTSQTTSSTTKEEN